KRDEPIFFTGSVRSILGNCVVSGLVARLGRHILNHRFNSPQVRADASSPDFTGCSRIKTKKPATEVVGFFAIIAGSIWFTGDVFGGWGNLNIFINLL
ncbi:hypothetical protein, partial [Serratia marcescens]|uniref:hypothetical protein n=2 Tax=Serratia TaxID=613 RepID=UPI001A7E178F